MEKMEIKKNEKEVIFSKQNCKPSWDNRIGNPMQISVCTEK